MGQAENANTKIMMMFTRGISNNRQYHGE